MAKSVELSGRGSRAIILASVCLTVTALYFGREVLIPLALAVLFSFLLMPVVRWLERLRFPRGVATIVVVLVAMMVIVLIGYVVGHQFASVLEQLPSYQGELHKKIEGFRRHGGVFHRAEEEFHSITKSATATQPAASQPATTNILNARSLANAATGTTPAAPPPEQPIPVRIVPPESSTIELIKEYATSFLDPLATAGLVLILVIFMMLTAEDLRDRIIRLVGHGRITVTTQALDEAATRISRYLGALAIVNGAYGAIVAAGLAAIGHLFGQGRSFPNVLVWGLLVGLFRFVPYLGILIGASVPLVLSFALFPGSAVFIGVVLMFVVMDVVVSQFIEPYWYGASTGMSPLAVLVAAIFWTWLWGPVGLLLSTPLTVCLVVMGKYIPQLQFLDIILGDEPVLPPHVRLYQRLVAADEDEASEMAQELLKEKTLVQVYDEVFIPALAMAEHDHYRRRLDEERLDFVRQSLRDMVDELGEEARAKRIRLSAAQTEQAAKDQSPQATPTPRPLLPKDCTVNVLTLPAKNESDEIVAMMLTQVLEMRGYCASFAGVDLLASEMVQLIETRGSQVVAVSAMPPAAVAHARYLCKRIHARFPDIGMAVGVWMTSADPEKVKHRIACDESVRLLRTIADAEHDIDQMAQRFITVGETPEPATV